MHVKCTVRYGYSQYLCLESSVGRNLTKLLLLLSLITWVLIIESRNEVMQLDEPLLRSIVVEP